MPLRRLALVPYGPPVPYLLSHSLSEDKSELIYCLGIFLVDKDNDCKLYSSRCYYSPGLYLDKDYIIIVVTSKISILLCRFIEKTSQRAIDSFPH